MTLGDVKREVLNLGFETKEGYEEEPSILSDAINRALQEITGVFPIVGRFETRQRPLPNLLPDPAACYSTRHYDGETPLVYHARAAASVVFECAGNGVLSLSDADGVRELSLESKHAYREYRLFVRGDVTLTFGGEFAYDVKNIAIYGQRYSDHVEDIPSWRRHIRYDLRELTREDGRSVFLGMLDRIEESDGRPYARLADFDVEQGRVLVLDGSRTAQFTVFYRKSFLPFAVDAPDDAIIPLDADKTHLLPLLAAWYVWADDEPDKAARWRNDYEDFKMRLMQGTERVSTREAIENITGW